MNLREKIRDYLWKIFIQRQSKDNIIYPISGKDIERATNYLLRLFREAKKEEKKKETKCMEL